MQLQENGSWVNEEEETKHLLIQIEFITQWKNKPPLEALH